MRAVFTCGADSIWLLGGVPIGDGNGERLAPRLLILLHALILFHGLRGNRGRGFRAVAYLRVGRARGDCAPSLATRHARAHRHANKHR